MKVEKNNIVLDDEFIALDNVTLIDVVKQGSPFDKPKFCLNVGYVDGTNRTIDMYSYQSRIRLFDMLSKLGDKIIKEGNKNFGNIGIALINMDYVDGVTYNVDTGLITIDLPNNQSSTFEATRAQAKRVLTRAEDAYRYYNHINEQQL